VKNNKKKITPNKLVLIVSLAVFVSLGLLAGVTMGEVKQVDPGQKSVREPGVLVDHNEFMVTFWAKLLLKRDRTQILIPFAFDGPTQILLLGFTPTKNEHRSDRLISHPFLMDLNWEKVSSGELFLYQREKKFGSIEEFLTNLPPVEKIAADGLLMDRYPEIVGSASTYSKEDLSQVDYILTTFNKPELVNGVWYWEGIIDATGARISEDKSVEWYIKAPLAEENRNYKLGSIKIEYLQ